MLEAQTVSVAFCFCCLIYASLSDLKTRTVGNWLWVFMAAVGVPLATCGILTHAAHTAVQLIFSVLSTSVLAFFCFRLGLFGGADAKALICISLLIPSHFSSGVGAVGAISCPFAVTTLFNAALLSTAAPLSVFFYNLFQERKIENVKLMFVGYKVPVGELACKKYVRLVHSYEKEVVGEGEGEDEGEGEGEKVVKRFSFGGVEIDEETVKRLKEYAAEGKIEDEVWVTPELPFMLFITAGFFISVVCGNLIMLVFSLP